MRFNKVSNVLVIVAIVGIVGFAATSFAGWGRGGGYCGGQGPGWGRGGYAASGYQGNLSDEQITKLNQERQAFFQATGDLRENLYQKELELRSELAKKDPDAKKAAELQKEISDLESQLDQKRVEHRIKMQKENPDFFADRNYGYGGRGMGRGFYGQGMGPGMGPGFGGRGGGCWY